MSKSWFITPVSLAIRKYLTENRRGSPRGFYDSYKIFKPTTSYTSITRTFWILSELGLIAKMEIEQGEVLYAVVLSHRDDDRWNRPQKAMYPEHFRGKQNGR